MRKKLLSLALALALCLSLTIPAAAAASVTTVKPLEGYSEDSVYSNHVFSEGILTVDLKGTTGTTFLDSSGNAITDEYYASHSAANARAFSEGLAVVSPKRANSNEPFPGYGYIDKTGKMVIAPQPQYDYVGNFHDGVALVRDKETQKYGMIDTTGKLIIPCEYIRESLRNSFYLHEASEGLILAYDAPNGYWGYFDTKGNVAIPFQYAYANDFEGGCAKVKLGQKETYIDKTGRDIIPDQYAGQYPFLRQLTVDGEPAALIAGLDVNSSETNRQYLLNGSGQVIAGPYSEIGTNFSCGLLPVTKHDGKSYLMGYINTAGQEVIPCGQFQGSNSFVDGYAMVTLRDGNGTPAIINTAGQVTATLENYKYKKSDGMQWSEGFLAVYSDESGKTRYGFINASGQLVVDYKYQSVGAFSNGLAVVTDFAGKKGVVNTAGQEVIPCKYDTISKFVNGVAEVSIDDRQDGYAWGYGLINTAGQEILPRNYAGRNTGELMQLLVENQEVSLVLENLRNGGKGGYDFVHITTDYSPAATTPAAPAAPAQPSGPSASPTNSKVLVNGKEVAFDAYTIDGSNYFKLRDLAYVLSGTEKQFEVGWDNASKTITLTSGSAYTANGSEMASGGGGSRSAAVSASKLLIDGKEVSLTAYTIDGNNYFKLRDIGQAFDFGVGWDNASKTITIDTSAGYTA